MFSEKNLSSFPLTWWLELPCHTYLKDVDGKYLICNDSQAAAFGFENGNQILGQTDSNFFSKQDSRLLLKNDLDVLKSEEPKIIIECVRFPEDSYKRMVSFKVPYKNHQGSLIGVLGASMEMDSREMISAIGIPMMMNKIDPSSTKVSLSKREKECVENLAHGLTAKQIAIKLNLSHRTVEFYIEKLRKEFNCSNSIELIAKTLPFLEADTQ